MILIYNTLSGKKEEFIPISKDNTVRLYSCGATVQSEPHIGHIRAAITADIIKRVLILNNFKVISVYNFTDIDDKLILKQNTENRDYRSIADENIQKYMDAMKFMNLLPFTYYPHATKHIQEIINMIEKLIKKDYAYVKNGDVYFRVNNFKSYGKLSKKNINDLISGKRVDVIESKENPLDFVLWKGHKDNEPYWYSPFGKGRPGWHIECSAMSTKYLSESFDIHTGGEDLIFPHHENEIAQSEACYGKTFVKYWVHNGMVNIKGEKMSKSIGNVFNIAELKKQFSANTIKLYLYKTHYRKNLEFSIERLKEAESGFNRIKNAIISKDEEIDKSIMNEFIDCLNNDFNTPNAISVIFETVNKIHSNKYNNKILSNTLYKMLLSIGFSIKDNEENISDELMQLILSIRNYARLHKHYDVSDYIREQLQKIDIELMDTKQGTKWKKKE